jgi:hypothetical protein
MSQHQFGWNRSYRQALELLITTQAERKLNFVNTRSAAMAQLEFVARFYSIAETKEVLADLAIFRKENAAWVAELEREGK